MEIKLLKYDSLGSTNDEAMKLLDTGNLSEGSVVWAMEQTAGRGQGKNIWESAAGKNLTFSIILQPGFIRPENQFIITQLVSVVLARTVSGFIKRDDVRIKWPNDIYVGDKKIAGILIQNTLMGDRLNYSVIGIGLNVNQVTFYSDAPNPVSLINFTNEEISHEEVLAVFFEEFSSCYTRLKNGHFEEELKSEYRKNLYRYNIWSEFYVGKDLMKGKISGTGEYGRLLLTLEIDRIESFDFGEIKFKI